MNNIISFYFNHLNAVISALKNSVLTFSESSLYLTLTLTVFAFGCVIGLLSIFVKGIKE